MPVNEYWRQRAAERVKWIWRRYEDNGEIISSDEIREQFGRAGRELEKELKAWGYELPPILAYKDALAIRQSKALMEASNNGAEELTRGQAAAVLDLDYTSVNHVLRKLDKKGLPRPKIKRVNNRRFREDVELPEGERFSEAELYPSGLPIVKSRTRVVNGQKIYMIR